MRKFTIIGDHQRTLSRPELGHRLPFQRLSRMQVAVPKKIGHCLTYTEKLLDMNLKRPDASPDELFREESQLVDQFVREAAVSAKTIRRNQETEQ
jgi:hypothetical protein